jgi:hypothetical protein
MPSSILVRQEKLLLPQGLAVRLMKTFPGAFGSALPLPAKETVLAYALPKPPALASLNELDKKAQNSTFIVQFTDYNLDTSQAPPYSIIADAAGPRKLVVFASGDWTGKYPAPEGKPKWSGIIPHLQKRIPRDLKMSGGDLPKFVTDYFDNDENQAELLEGGIGPCTLVFVHADGEVKVVRNEDAELLSLSSPEWGYVSDPLDWTSGEKKATKADDPDDILAAVFGGDGEKTNPPGVHTISDKTTAVAVDNKDKTTLSLKGTTAAVPAASDEFVHVQIPPTLSRREKREFIGGLLKEKEEDIGQLHPGYNDLTQIKVPSARVKELREKGLKLITSPYRPFADTSGAKVNEGEAEKVPGKTETPASPLPAKTDPAKAPQPDVVSAPADQPDDKIVELKRQLAAKKTGTGFELKPEEKAQLVTQWTKEPEILKILEHGGEEISLDVLRDIEKNLPRSYTLVGEENVDFFRKLSPATLERLVTGNPKWSYLLVIDLLIALAKSDAIAEKLDNDRVAHNM